MAEQNIRLLVLGFLFLGLFVSCQYVHLHGIIIQAAESREVKLGRRFMFDDTRKEEVRGRSQKNPSGPNPIGNRHPPSIHG
ncbi:unnamed protein product [Citrullus colocynthis]|uniref:Uncharacterized protein n=1 Tax=Citrullus colocynthis TaxID=252529 RepID=A0ABP0YTS1_9ROSI